jgi:hypothetical protein
MMRRLLWALIVGSAMSMAPGAAPAQMMVPAVPYRLNGFFAAPGYYGTSYGVPSYGLTRTYSVYASPFGAGYGSGYAPYGMLPGRYGVGLWRPGFVAPGYVYGASYYQTYAVPYSATANVPLPPIGLYAPGFGAAGYYGW